MVILLQEKNFGPSVIFFVLGTYKNRAVGAQGRAKTFQLVAEVAKRGQGRECMAAGPGMYDGRAGDVW